MPVAWPGTLPTYWARTGFQEQEASNLIVSAMEVGPAKKRRRTTTATRSVKGSMYLTDAQYATFRTFFITDTAHGALTFTLNDAHGTSRTFGFAGPPQYTPDGANSWMVQMQLEEYV